MLANRGASLDSVLNVKASIFDRIELAFRIYAAQRVPVVRRYIHRVLRGRSQVTGRRRSRLWRLTLHRASYEVAF